MELQVEETAQVTAAEKVEQQQKNSGAAGGAAVEKNSVALQVEQQ